MMSSIVKALDSVRDSLTSHQFNNTLGLHNLGNILMTLPVDVKDNPAVIALLKDLHELERMPSRLVNIKDHIKDEASTIVASVFDSPYFPSLSFEAFCFETLPPPLYLLDKFKSPVKAVKLISATKGLYPEQVVAVFPENHIDNSQLPDDPIFYFIDKFVSRFYRVTCKLFDKVKFRDIDKIANLAEKEVYQLSTYWVWLHEYYHRQGAMPIPAYLPYKSLRPLAGLEELRVDLASIICALDGAILPGKFGLRLAIFILAERLLRYPVEGGLRPSYDAIASQTLFNFLREKKFITFSSDYVMTWHDDIFEGLTLFYNRINSIESTIKYFHPEVVQQKLLDFVNQYNPPNSKGGFSYNYNDCFLYLKERYLKC